MPVKKKRTRHLSPSYPGVGLKTCVNYVEKLHRSAGQAEVSKENALKYLGLESGKPITNRTYSALSTFGLIEERHYGKVKKVTVTQLARQILLAKGEHSLVKISALQTAALNYEIIRKLRMRWSEGLPGDDDIFNVLMFDHTFGDRAAKTFIPSFKETYKYAKLGGDTPSVNQIADVPENDAGFVSESDKEIESSPIIMKSEKGLSGYKEYTLSLGKDKEVRLFLSNKLTSHQLEFMLSWIDQLDILESSPNVNDDENSF